MRQLGEVALVPVGPFRVAAIPRAQVVAAIAGYAEARRGWGLGLHVGALNRRDDQAFLAAASRADLVFADGVAIVALARARGAATIERAPTTDIAHDVIDAAGERLGRALRVALVGGPPGLAENAARVLEERHDCEVVAVNHGFVDDWQEVVDLVAGAEPDLLFLGLGLPLEAIVAAELQPRLSCAIHTVGGWFGHVTGAERRAPAWMQEHGAEWVWRLAQQPRRLAARYARGLVSFLGLWLEAVWKRVRGEDAW